MISSVTYLALQKGKRNIRKKFFYALEVEESVRLCRDPGALWVSSCSHAAKAVAVMCPHSSV